MSGGYFDYKQDYIRDIVESIEEEISHNKVKPDWIDDSEWDGQMYSDSVITQFESAVEILKKAEIYAKRIDWLLSGDDGEESFLKRLKEDLAKVMCG